MREHIEYFDLNAISPPGTWTIFLYGEKSKRKTTTACSMINRKGLLVSADNSWSVLQKPMHKDLRDKTTLVIYDTLKQLEYLEYEKFDTVIFDTASVMVARYLDLLFEHSTWGGKYREKLVSKHEELKDTTMVHAVDYRVLRDKFRPIIERIISLPVNKIFTSHVNHPKKGLSEDMTRRPIIPDSTLSLILHPSDVVGFIESSGSKEPTINVDDNSMYCLAGSRMEGISGKMSLSKFVANYKEVAFGS